MEQLTCTKSFRGYFNGSIRLDIRKSINNNINQLAILQGEIITELFASFNSYAPCYALIMEKIRHEQKQAAGYQTT